jgi:hypothetical protein
MWVEDRKRKEYLRRRRREEFYKLFQLIAIREKMRKENRVLGFPVSYGYPF